MNRILRKEILAADVFLLEIEAPRIARRYKPGQFVILRPAPRAERIPLTVVDASVGPGSITLVIKIAGKTTQVIAGLEGGEAVADILGPLGEPTRVENVGKVVCVGGGIGVAAILPVVRAMRAAGNEVTALCGARSEAGVILGKEMESAANHALWATQDGSFGFAGNVAELMGIWIKSQPQPPALVHVAGPAAMMRAAADLTRGWPAPTVASLNPIMVDGIGMCGGCRVVVGGRTRFACVEGPEFDAHQVDFEELSRRNRTYTEEERRAFCPHKE